MTSFDDVRYGFMKSSCSVEIAESEPDGIRIAVLPRFVFSNPPNPLRPPNPDADEIPLCLSAKLNDLLLSRFEHLFMEVKVVVVDDEHDWMLTGGVWRDRHFVRHHRKLTPEELERLATTSSYEYSTVNLLEFFELPRRAATYKIYAVLEEYKSNVATLQVEVQ